MRSNNAPDRGMTGRIHRWLITPSGGTTISTERLCHREKSKSRRSYEATNGGRGAHRKDWIGAVVIARHDSHRPTGNQGGYHAHRAGQSMADRPHTGDRSAAQIESAASEALIAFPDMHLIKTAFGCGRQKSFKKGSRDTAKGVGGSRGKSYLHSGTDGVVSDCRNGRRANGDHSHCLFQCLGVFGLDHCSTNRGGEL